MASPHFKNRLTLMVKRFLTGEPSENRCFASSLLVDRKQSLQYPSRTNFAKNDYQSFFYARCPLRVRISSKYLIFSLPIFNFVVYSVKTGINTFFNQGVIFIVTNKPLISFEQKLILAWLIKKRICIFRKDYNTRKSII